jgi:ADP-ribose pyrophosphatase
MRESVPAAQVHRIKEIHRGKVFRLQRETVTLPNDLNTQLDVIRHPGAVAVVPLLDESHVILIHQYRHAVGSFIWEIPAGTLSEGEEPLDCARRELREETGYDPGSLRKLGEIVPVPGYADERIHIYLATDLKSASQHLDEDEVLDVKAVPLARALAMIDDGEIVDAKTIVGLLRGKPHFESTR